MMSAQVDSDLWGTARFVDSVRLPYIAPSLGGVDSLIEQPTVISYWDQVHRPFLPQKQACFLYRLFPLSDDPWMAAACTQHR